MRNWITKITTDNNVFLCKGSYDKTSEQYDIMGFLKNIKIKELQFESLSNASSERFQKVSFENISKCFWFNGKLNFKIGDRVNIIFLTRKVPNNPPLIWILYIIHSIPKKLGNSFGCQFNSTNTVKQDEAYTQNDENFENETKNIRKRYTITKETNKI
jgi:hypothetical protein